MPNTLRILIPRPPRPCLLPLRSIFQPAVYFTPNHVSARLKSSAFREWSGSGDAAHTVHKAKKGDGTDPEADSSIASMKDRRENQGIADQTKSQATTERGGLKFGRKAKEEHPNAPEPVIGMNDERAGVGLIHPSFWFFKIFWWWLGRLIRCLEGSLS